MVQQESARSPGMVQRAEVDDRSCAGLKDIEPDIDTEVNKEIDDARKAAGTPMNVTTLLAGVVQRLGAGAISPIERFIEGLGSSKTKIPPTNLSGTKYQGVGAVNNVYALQGTKLRVVADAANVHRICVGSDKIGHFFGQGADYFDVMLAKGAKTKDAESAGRAMEIGIFGLGVTGVFSNADLAANLAGLKFYQDLKKNPTGYKFHIKDYITAKWNEQTNPSFYESQVGGVVWSNLLNGTWKGPRTSRGGSSDSEVDFTATNTTLIGNYEWPAGSKSPNKYTITGGAITQKTTKVSGKEPGESAVSDTPVSGISIQFDWNEGKSSGKGQWDSKNEQTLEGTWGHGKAKIGGGTWKLKKV